MQGKQHLHSHANRKSESVWFKTKRVSQFMAFGFLLTNPFYLSYLQAAPTGGNVVGGTGSISHSELTTTINQASQNVAIDWQSFNVNSNERVHFIQPNSSSIALNRILDNNGSVIQGQIDANGQVILINPNGVFFTPTATVNVGGLIASSLDMTPADFMNGNYIFNEVLGADGVVINSGIINASLGELNTGGNVALIGKQVKNEGLISANLGSVVLAAGKQSILTFDNQGLIGVSVTKEVLQSELGLEAAVTNSGEITAAGGRVLLTASTSQDIFSQAVNTSKIEQAKSVVVNEDGSYTLGLGADVINSGLIDVSSQFNETNIARIILVGENVTSSGELIANTVSGSGGEIELHAKDTTLLTGNSNTSAQSLSSGVGGIVKILADKVGLFEQSTINVSGFNGGGQTFIGGGFQGSNPYLKNSSVTLLSLNSNIYSDAVFTGNGGKTIVWSNGSTVFRGLISGKGGLLYGDGGFTEVSGKTYLGFYGNVMQGAFNGSNGQLLLDPKNLTIVAGSALPADKTIPDDFDEFSDDPSVNSTIGAEEVARALQQNDLTLKANNDILIQASINEAAANNTGGSLDNNFTLRAGRSIKISDSVSIELDDKNFDAQVNDPGVELSSTNRDTDELAVFSMGTGASITTRGGAINIVSGDRDVGASGLSDDLGNFTLAQLSTVETASDGGDININNLSGDITLNGTLTSDGGTVSGNSNGKNAGKIEIVAGNNVVINNTLSANGSAAAAIGQNLRKGGFADLIRIFSGTAASTQITLNADISAIGGNGINGGVQGWGGRIDINTPKLITNGTRTISALGLNPLDSTVGDINIYYDGVGTLYNVNPFIVSDLLLNGNLTITTGSEADINLRQDIDYDGLTSNGTLLLEAGDRINIHKISDSDTSTADLLNVSLKANNDNGSTGILSLFDSITTGNGTFLATASTYDGRSYTGEDSVYHKVKIDTGTAGATITSLYRSLLGEMKIGGDLTVTAGTTSETGGVITQEDSTDILDVTGTATFNVTGSTDNDFIVLNNNNLLRGQINFATNTDAVANVVDSNISLRNTYISTTLNNVTAYGNLTVNATGNLTIAEGGVIRAISQDSGTNGVIRTINLNFGLNDVAGTTDSTFTSTGATFEGNSSGNDIIILNITGGAGHNVFNFNTSVASPVVTSFTNLNNITVTGNGGNDTFNFNNSVAGNTIDFTNIDSWTVNGNDGLDIFNTEQINFTSVSNIAFNGGNDKDTFNIRTNIEGTTSGALNGGSGNDDFNILSTGLIISNINGDGGTDKIISANELNIWDVTSDNAGAIYSDISKAASTKRLDFSSIENLTGNADVDQFDLAADVTNAIDGMAGADVFNISSGITGAINGGLDNDTFNINATSLTLSQKIDGGDGADELVAANELNVWDVTLDNAGAIYSDSSKTVSTKRLDFSSIEILTGNAAVDQFDLASDITGSVSGLGGNDIFNINTNVTGTMVGGLNDDTFNISSDYTGTLSAGDGNDTFEIMTIGLVLSQQLNGDAGTDELIAANELNVWDITVQNEGSIFSETGKITQRLTFTSFETLTGNAAVDQFDLGNNVSNQVNGMGGQDIFNIGFNVSGSINGGAGDDTFNIKTANLSINSISGGTNTTGAGNGDIINAADEINYWDITGAGSGTIAASSTDTPRLTFSGIENITGSDTYNDAFVFSTLSSSISGVIDGGESAGDNDIVDLSLAGLTNDIILGSTVGYTNIEEFIGNGANSTITGENYNTTWLLTSNNTGTITYLVNGDTQTTVSKFTNFAKLNGGSAVDTFQLGFDVTSEINGNGGNDIYNISANITGVMNGGAGEDIFNINATGLTITSIVGGGNSDTLTAANETNYWDITAQNTGAIYTDSSRTTKRLDFSSIETLNGNTAADDFNLAFDVTNQINGLGGNDSFTIGTTITGAIAGGAGTDTLTADNVANFWDITAQNAGSIYTDTSRTTKRLDFSGIETLNGNNATDRFNLAFDITNQINGQDGRDRFDISTAISGTINGGAANDDFYLNNTALTFSQLLQGGTGTDTLYAANENNYWDLNTVNGGEIFSNPEMTVKRLSFSAIESVVGNAGTDIFLLNGTNNFTGAIDGDTGIDKLTAGTRSNNWAITNTTSGTVSGNTFTRIEELVGGGSDDYLQLHATADFAGTFDGAAGVDEIIGGDRANTWTITEENAAGTEVAGTVTGLTGTLSGFTTGSFKNVETLTGNNNSDDYSLLTGVNFNGSINGLGGNNSLTAGNFATNTWTITARNTGTVTGLSGTFSNIQSITGGTFIDEFNFNQNGFIEGLIDGNSILNVADSGRDVVNITAFTGDTTVMLGTKAAYDPNVLNIDNVEQIDAVDGGTSIVNTIVGDDRLNTWTITADNTGYVQETGSTNTETRTAFSNFEIVHGGALDDAFQFEGTSQITDTIDGKGGVNSIDYSAVIGSVEVNLNDAGTGSNKILNVTGVKGNKTNSTIFAKNGQVNTWDFYGTNRGEVDGVVFTDFNILEGGNLTDTFNFNGTSPQAISNPIVQTIGLQINGNAGDDTLNITLSDAEKGLINFNGGTFTTTSNYLTIDGGSTNYTTTYSPDVDTNTDNLSYTSGLNTFAVNYTNADTVQDDSIANTLALTGTGVNDTFTLTDTTFNVTATTPGYVRSNVITYSGKNNVTVTGGANDILEISSALTVSGDLTLDINTINANGNLITATGLILANTNKVSALTLNTSIDRLSANNTGDLIIIENDGVNLTGLNTSNLLDIRANGTVSSSNVLTTSSQGSLAINTTAGNIDLSNPSNALSGGLTLNAPGSVTLTNSTATLISGITSNSLNIDSMGAISQTGTITTGSTALSSDSNIILALNNDFDSLGISKAIDVRVNDIDDLAITNINTSGFVNITTNGLLSLGSITSDNVILNSGSGSISGTGTNIISNGTVDLTATGGITVGLDLNGSLSATNTGSGDIVVTKTGELILEDITNNNPAGGFSIVSNGGDITVKKVNLNYDNSAAEANFEFNSSGDLYGDLASLSHITANRLVIDMKLSGSVGKSNAEPIITDVKDYIEVTGALGTYIRFLNGVFNGVFVGENEYKNIALQIIENLAGQQLIQVETLSEVDPAIFTDVRNYSNSEIALMMPSDQLFTDDDDEDKKAKEKRQNFSNSNP